VLPQQFHENAPVRADMENVGRVRTDTAIVTVGSHGTIRDSHDSVVR
jgi:hypothetical protein